MAETVADTGTIDPAEVAKFAAMADDWWDPDGSAKPLHWMNPCRLGYVVSQLAAEFERDSTRLRSLEGLRLVDVGCGGGLLCEPLARLGAEVVGIDAAVESIAVAKLHARQMDLEIDYRATTAEALAAEGAQFDAVLGLEIIEHVTDKALFLEACATLVRPGGLFITSTLNRTPQSYLMAILGAEYVLRWLPKGTHDWSKFVTPDEYWGLLSAAGLDPVDRKGIVLDPLRGIWKLSAKDLAVNYVLTSRRAG